MSRGDIVCPCCGSEHIASRRELFHSLMADRPLSGPFSWYDVRTRGACPPKSLFLMLLVMIAVLALPAAGLWLRELYPVLVLLAYGILGLLACLVFDFMATWRRYRTWAGQWLCSECREVFKPGQAGADYSPLS